MEAAPAAGVHITDLNESQFPLTRNASLSRKPNIHQSQSSSSALAGSPHPGKQDLLALILDLLANHAISLLPLLTLCKT